MKVRRLASVVLVAVVLVACSGGESGTPTTTRATSPATCRGCPTYDEGDTAIGAAPGERFVVELEANPSTGYEWSVTSSDESVVRPPGEEHVAPDTDRVGAPGTQRLVFTAEGAGSATLTLTYARSFEPDDPEARTLVVAVTVA